MKPKNVFPYLIVAVVGIILYSLLKPKKAAAEEVFEEKRTPETTIPAEISVLESTGSPRGVGGYYPDGTPYTVIVPAGSALRDPGNPRFFYANINGKIEHVTGQTNLPSGFHIIEI